MTVGEMLGLTNRLKEIKDCETVLKDVRLANLMTDMERAYEIPALNDTSFNKQNPHVIAMYRTVSEERSFKGVESV